MRDVSHYLVVHGQRYYLSEQYPHVSGSGWGASLIKNGDGLPTLCVDLNGYTGGAISFSAPYNAGEHSRRDRDPQLHRAEQDHKRGRACGQSQRLFVADASGTGKRQFAHRQRQARCSDRQGTDPERTEHHAGRSERPEHIRQVRSDTTEAYAA